VKTNLSNRELERRLHARRAELRERAARIAADLRRETQPIDADAPDRAIQRENDEVLLALGEAARSEMARIDVVLAALARDGSVKCDACGRSVEPARLAVVPAASRCLRCMQAPAGEVAPDLELEDAFRECDEDGDGGILPAEFQRLLARCGSTLSPERQRAEFDGLDRNGDGRVDWNEFKVWWEKR